MGLFENPPSAVATMLQALAAPMPVQQTSGQGLLGPGAPAPAMMSSQQPRAPGPMAAPSQSGQGILGHIHDWISNKLDGPSAPAGFDGLLSRSEIEGAKPSFMQRLASITPGDAAPSEKYKSNLIDILKMHQVAKGMADDQKNSALRQEVGSVLSNTQMHPDERFAALTKLLGVAFQMGDDKVMGAIANAMQTAKPPVAVPKQYEPKAFELGGKVVWVKPGEPVPDGAKPFHEAPTPAPDRTIVQVEGPNGPVWSTREGAIGQPVKKAGMAGSAQNMASEALLRSSVSEMNKSDTAMQQFENDLASGKKSINGLAGFISGVGNSFTHDDPASRLAQQAALGTLNRVNPDLARYIRRGLAFAEGEAGISKRPSDFRTKMAAFLSTAASGASPEMIGDIQSRRRSLLDPLNSVVGGSTSKGSGSASGTKPRSKLDDYRHLLR